MGFHMGIIHSIIDRIYFTQARINFVEDKKMAVSEAIETLGKYQSMAVSADPQSFVRFKPFNVDRLNTGGFRRVTGNPFRTGDPYGGGAEPRVDPSVYTVDPVLQNLINTTPGIVMDPATAPARTTQGMETGELLMKKETAESLYKTYLAKLSSMEKGLDRELEKLRADYQAFVGEKEEFQKYCKDEIEFNTKNAYA